MEENAQVGSTFGISSFLATWAAAVALAEDLVAAEDLAEALAEGALGADSAEEALEEAVLLGAGSCLFSLF